MEQIFELCTKYDITISHVDKNIIPCALGIGDLMRLLSCIKYGVWNGPMYINLECFTLYNNPLNYIEFRLKLINQIIIYNNIDLSKIVFFLDENNISQQLFHDTINISLIKNIKLNFNTKNINNYDNEEYIIFHTKCRFHLDKEQVLKDLKIFDKFIRHLKISYKIYILGEKQIHRTNFEVVSSPDIITQIYDILFNLSNNNQVIDKTTDCIIDNLNYDNFIEDINLIQNAKYNIHFGDGGGMNMSMIFGKNNTIIYNRDMDEWNKEILQQENTYIYNNINQFIYKIRLELNGEITANSVELRKIQRKEEQQFIRNKLFKQKNMVINNNNNFDWQAYLNHYPDLSIFTTQDAAWQHWIHCGKPEGRQFFYK